METTDIITPLVDDPFTFGRIAAANALSDVFAMGGRPVTAMNLVFFPACVLPGRVLAEILAGGQAPGDRLILTKPLGTGIVSTAIKADMVTAETATEAIGWMTMLNARAAAIMMECGATACTDVTGFGLIGHATEMAIGAGVTIRLRLDRVPVMTGVAGLIGDGLVPAGCYRNRDHYSPQLKAVAIPDEALLPLFDPQTSGGLLISLPPEAAERFLAAAAEQGCYAVPVGEVLERREHPVEIV